MATGWSAPSEEELGKDRNFPVLSEDEYIAEVTGIEIKPDAPNTFPSKGDDAPTHEMIILKAKVLSFADGEPLVDVNGEEPETDVLFQTWLNPKKRGMIPQPSKTRKAFAAILGQPVGATLDIPSFEELVGKTFIVSLKPNNGYNNAFDFRPHKRVRTRATTPRGPVEGSEIMDRAREIFDEDAPTNRSPAPAIGDLDF